MRRLVMAAILTLGGVTTETAARQYLVTAGDGWQGLVRQVGPGDEIILMSGRHRTAVLESLHGEPDRPIVIRGLDPADPPIIEAERYGLRFIDPRHVVLKDVVVVGATINGVLAEGLTDGDAADENGTSGPLVIERVTVRETGPADAPTADGRHALHVRNVDDVRINDCTIAGWSGSGIEIVGGREVRIRGCTLTGHDDRHQVSGVRLRAGVVRARVERCRFVEAGDQALSIGGASTTDEFFPPVAEDARPGTQFEATRVTVNRCVFRGGLCAVSYVSCSRAIVRNCTIVRPRRAVVSIRRDQSDPRFAMPLRCAFGGNLVTWEEGDLTQLAHLGPGAKHESVLVEANLWWTAAGKVAVESLGAFPGRVAVPQVITVDPMLDGDLRATADDASGFGANLE